MYKKGDKIECENYKGISLLNLAYKICFKLLLNRINPYIEENLGEYQCGFRKGRPTIEQQIVIGQIIEKKYAFQEKILANMYRLKKKPMIVSIKRANRIR